MKRVLFFIFVQLFPIVLFAQNIVVESFVHLETDLTANLKGTTVYDQNGEKCALIKVRSNPPTKDFSFDLGVLDVVETAEKEAEEAIWDSIIVEGETEISTIISNLLPQTTYVFKAFLTIENTLIEGEELTFTTDESSLADVENSIQVNLYPNPVKEKVYLEVKGLEGKVECVISDLQGRILRTFEVKSNRMEIDLREYSSGVYYLKVYDEKTTRTCKIIKD